MERKPDRNSERKVGVGAAKECVNIADDSAICGTPDPHRSFEISEQLKYAGRSHFIILD